MPRTITRLAAQKKNTNRVSVYLDGEYAFGIHIDLVAPYGLGVGRTVSEDEVAEMASADALLVAKALAFNYLSHRPRTVHEIRTKLAEKDFGAEVADPVIARLGELGYLDDDAYAREYVRARFAGKGYGPGRIRTELLRRGVDRAVVEAVLAAFFEDKDPLAAARVHAEKRWPRLAAEPDPRKRKKKLSDFLIRRGFTFDTVRRIVDEMADREA